MSEFENFVDEQLPQRLYIDLTTATMFWNAALEAAAAKCDAYNRPEGSSETAAILAQAIRALKHTPEQSNGK